MESRETELGKWIREKFRSQVKFGEKIGAHPTMISRWMGGGGISEDYEKAIRKLGYTGPWPREETQEAPAPPAGAYVTRGEYEAVPGRLTRLEDDSRALLPLIRLVEDLNERVKKLEKRLGPTE